jgi:hypothetical protein
VSNAWAIRDSLSAFTDLLSIAILLSPFLSL